jgi:hypothetical protein
MKTLTRSLACLVVAGGAAVVALGGCGKDEKPMMKPKPVAMEPATKPAMKESVPTPVAAAPAAPAVKMDEKDMTHACMSDAPMFTDMPTGAAGKPAMMLKKGEKVVVMVPGRKYSQVTTIGGVKGYVPTASLKPLGS